MQEQRDEIKLILRHKIKGINITGKFLNQHNHNKQLKSERHNKRPKT